MPDCGYCEETFDDEDAYLAHLRDAHEAELSRIDRRRVRQSMEDDGGSRVIVYGAVAVVLVLLAAAVYVTVLSGDGGSTSIEARPLPDSGDDSLLGGVQQFPSQGNAHVASDTQIDYSTSPPTSGPHYNLPAEAGFYDEPVPAGNLVHSLEHGAVVIYYDPAAITPAEEESLRAFASNNEDPWASVIVVPNPSAEPESPYVLTAWRTMLRTDEYDPDVVRAFLAEYVGRGPENPVR
jgi:hypothetical protein